MINIIICDDIKRDLEKVYKNVNNFFKTNGIECKIHLFNDYDSKFMKIVKEKLPFKIYILDIETPSRSGIDVARDIRKKDIDSVIIFLTGHEELGNLILKNDLMFLSFINKFDNLKNRLNNSLKKALIMLKQKQTIKVVDNNNTYIINLDDILYLTKESFERKTIIVLDYAQYKVNVPLSKITKMLDSRFIKTHRSCIINTNRLSRIDKKNRIIYFDNNTTTDLLSDRYKKEMNI